MKNRHTKSDVIAMQTNNIEKAWIWLCGLKRNTAKLMEFDKVNMNEWNM